MKDPIITYRGASARLSELQNTRVDQLQLQHGSRLIQYRGATVAEADLPHHEKKLTKVSYRGATAEVEL